jgi:hypothetical protein
MMTCVAINRSIVVIVSSGLFDCRAEEHISALVELNNRQLADLKGVIATENDKATAAANKVNELQTRQVCALRTSHICCLLLFGWLRRSKSKLTCWSAYAWKIVL